MASCLAAADAFILPTIYEPFSNACLEALAAGLPVITTVHNGFSEIIESGIEGEIVKGADDISALATAIRSWEDPERRALIRPRLMELGAQFSIEENVKKTLSLIAKAI
jgi:UDP-glucose:(heptosyl)LPS alpha-1,3-glucosyltransferase